VTPQRIPPLVLALVLAGAAIGYAAGPFLARASDTVRLATRVWHEESGRLDEQTLESAGWRSTGEAIASLMERARAVKDRYLWGGVLLGAWCGLVVACRLVASTRIEPHDDYHIDHAACVSCTRCFRSCPREHLRLKALRDRRAQASEEADG
jgi:hypothetical protein